MTDADFNLARQLLSPYAERHQVFFKCVTSKEKMHRSLANDVQEMVLEEAARQLGYHCLKHAKVLHEMSHLEGDMTTRAALWSFTADELCALAVDIFKAGVESTKVKSQCS